MSLAVALNNARTSLLTTAKQISVSGRNITGASEAGYTRKIAQSTTGFDGSSHIVSVARATDLALFYRVVSAHSSAAGQSALADGLDRLHDTIGDTADGSSPAARIGDLTNALRALADSPSDMTLAQTVVNAAQDVVSTLANASQVVTDVRNDADAAMASSVDTINDLLGQFAELNTQIVRGTTTGTDVNEALDHRDTILAALSQEIGITVVMRSDNDMAIYTDGGVTLFDKTPRTVEFDATASLPTGVAGGAIRVDGVPVTGDSATMPLRSGRLAGLASLRDEIAPAYQSQLDEMARGLVEAFAETDQSGGGGPALAGLFTWTGGPGVPASGVAVPGLATSLHVNPGADPAQGGSLYALRDGGVNGADYRYNPGGAASFSDRLNGVLDDLDAARAFDASGLPSDVSLLDLGTASVSWLEGLRSSTTQSADYQNTLLSRASEALSNATGVNMDDEYALQLQLEQSYAASSKLIGIIQQLFETLLDAVN